MQRMRVLSHWFGRAAVTASAPVEVRGPIWKQPCDERELIRCFLVQSAGEEKEERELFCERSCCALDFVHLFRKETNGVHAEGAVCVRVPG